MATPAHRLADTLETIRTLKPGLATAAAREKADMERAYRDYLWTVDALRRVEDGGADIAHYKDAARDWERMVVSAGSWDTSAQHSRTSAARASLHLLRAFADVAARSDLFAFPDRNVVEGVRAQLDDTQAFIEASNLADGFRLPMLGALDDIRVALDGYPSIDVAEATVKAALLLGYMTILAGSGRSDADTWRERGKAFRVGFFSGLAANAAYDGIGFAARLVIGC